MKRPRPKYLRPQVKRRQAHNEGEQAAERKASGVETVGGEDPDDEEDEDEQDMTSNGPDASSPRVIQNSRGHPSAGKSCWCRW